MIKAGIIRCQQTEDLCPGTTDFAFAGQGKGDFQETEPVVLREFYRITGRGQYK